jgi:hypothetical protein
MEYSTQFGQTFADVLEEMFVADDLGLDLNEIRDPKRLQAEIKRLSNSSHATAKLRVARLQTLHDKKLAHLERKKARLKVTKQKQHKIAKSFGYNHVGKGIYVHEKSGHTLQLHGDGLWSHIKNKPNSHQVTQGKTPIRTLKKHLRTIHSESVELGEQNINEIRMISMIQAEINKLALRPNDQIAQQKLLYFQDMRKKKLQALRNKTRSLNMSENEAEGIGYTTLKQYLQYVHENEDIAIEESVLAKELGMTLDEIRHPHILGARMNDLALKGNDPKSQQRFIRLQALKKRKEMLKRRSLMMGEDELDMNGVE